MSIAADFSLFIATPTNNSMVHVTYTKSLLGLAHACFAKNIRLQYVTTHSASILPAARNVMVDQFLTQTDLTHLLFLDSDMGFDPSGLLRLFEFAHLDVVAAMYPAKLLNWDKIADAARKNPQLQPDQLAEIAGSFAGMMSLPDGASFDVGDQPVEVARIGTGIMLISRNILEQLAKASIVTHHKFASKSRTIPAFFENGADEDNHYVGEDFIFCARVRAIGGKIWGCPWLRTTHSGNLDFIGNLGAIVGST